MEGSTDRSGHVMTTSDRCSHPLDEFLDHSDAALRRKPHSGTPHAAATLRDVVVLTGGAILYFLLAKFGMTLISLQPSNITLLWLPSGVAFALALHFGRMAWFWIFFASFAANFGGMEGGGSFNGLAHTGVSALIDAAAGLFAAAMYRRFLPGGINQVAAFLPFVVGVAFSTGLFTSLLLAVNLVIGGYIEFAGAGRFIVMITLADMLGVLLIAPLYLKRGLISEVSRKDLGPIAAATLALIFFFFAFYFGVFSGSIYLILPVLLLLSFYINMFWVSLFNLSLMIAVAVLTVNGYGDFAGFAEGYTYQHMMAFMIATSLTALGIGLQNQQLIVNQRLTLALRSQAETDPLTGLLNRRGFLRESAMPVRHALQMPTEAPLSVAVLDLDAFKSINDTFGHASGDEVLRRFADLLSLSAQRSDIVARFGGEEFIILLADCSINDAHARMEQVRHALETLVVKHAGRELKVTVSVGISNLGSSDQTIEGVIERADQALYEAKAAGRNRVHCVFG